MSSSYLNITCLQAFQLTHSSSQTKSFTGHAGSHFAHLTCLLMRQLWRLPLDSVCRLSITCFVHHFRCFCFAHCTRVKLSSNMSLYLLAAIFMKMVQFEEPTKGIYLTRHCLFCVPCVAHRKKFCFVLNQINPLFHEVHHWFCSARLSSLLLSLSISSSSRIFCGKKNNTYNYYFYWVINLGQLIKGHDVLLPVTTPQLKVQ